MEIADKKAVIVGGASGMARASADGTSEVRRFHMMGDRQSIRDWSAKAALAMLRLHLIGAPGVRLLREMDLNAK